MQNTFQTSDFPLGISLLCLGYKLVAIDCANPKRAEFCFLNQDGLSKSVDLFWKNELLFEPKEFYLNQKILKGRLFAEI